jgi:hypothetical protein
MWTHWDGDLFFPDISVRVCEPKNQAFPYCKLALGLLSIRHKSTILKAIGFSPKGLGVPKHLVRRIRLLKLAGQEELVNEE